MPSAHSLGVAPGPTTAQHTVLSAIYTISPRVVCSSLSLSLLLQHDRSQVSRPQLIAVPPHTSSFMSSAMVRCCHRDSWRRKGDH